ncbi:hypothetical protein [Flavobacterium sp. 14A]|uniref:hypothetical protein n=1 Tax=Flavobacterium sp. 14A TaxID=2735896 RepID=UPI00156D43D9|nr:hypothetical protein [Flavobacterium sp. 14A]NRT13633.1 hypothetical protein [Flavobacterium sp. 14A]
MKNLLLCLLVIFLYSFSSTEQNKIDSLSLRIKSLESTIKNKPVLPTTDYKETFYLTQLNNSVTLILSVIGFALVFAGFSSYHFINERFRLQERSIEQQITNVISNSQSLIAQSAAEQAIFKTEVSVKLGEYEKNYKKYESRHIDFEFVLDYIQGSFYANLFNKSVEEEDAEMSLYYALTTFSYFTNCCISKSAKSDNGFKNERVNYIITSLKNIKEVKMYSVDSTFGGTIYNNISNIRKLENIEIDTLLSEVQSSITYEIRKIS